MTDAELVARFCDGHAEAFNTLVRRWQGRVYNFVLRYAGDRDEAGDLCQQTFIRALASLHRLRQAENFSTWLHQIAVNVCRDQRRQKQRHAAQSLELFEEENGHPPAALRAPAEAGKSLHRRELGDLLNRALQAIPEEQRVVVVLKEYQGLKFCEIARILDAPINTVKSRLYYGLKALRKILDQWDIDEEIIGHEL